MYTNNGDEKNAFSSYFIFSLVYTNERGFLNKIILPTPYTFKQVNKSYFIRNIFYPQCTIFNAFESVLLGKSLCELLY